MFKNVASQSVDLFAYDYSTGAPKTGDAANMVWYVSKDHGTLTAITSNSGVPSEISSSHGPGWYRIALSQAETNADDLLFTGVSVTGNVAVVGKEIPTFPTTGILAPTVAGRTLDVSTTGEAGIDWANVGSPTTALALTGTTIAVTQKVDVDTIKTNPVVNAGTITFPTNSMLASTVNITAAAGCALTSSYDFAKGTVVMTEAYAANGAAPTPVQAMFAIHQMLMGFSIATTVYTVKKLDGSTTAFACTLNSSTVPTAIVRS